MFKKQTVVNIVVCYTQNDYDILRKGKSVLSFSSIQTQTFSYILTELTKHTNLNTSQMLQHINLTPKHLQQHKPIDSKKLQELFNYCLQTSHDENLALKIGASVSYHSLGLLGFLLLNSKNLEALIKTFFKYQTLVNGFSKFALEESEKSLKLIVCLHENSAIVVPKAHAEVHLSALLSILSQLLGEQLKPFSANFHHSQPNNLVAYKALFGTRLHFNNFESALIFTKEQLCLPLQKTDASLQNFFENEAKKLLNPGTSHTYTNLVEREILKLIGHAKLEISIVAKNLNFSTRTLQEKLKQESTNFRKILTTVRMQLAHYYLKNNIPASTIALLLDYSEPSAFFRAYKKYMHHKKKESL